LARWLEKEALMARHVMTARRKVALRKAQLASAKKRKRRRRRNIAIGSVGVLTAVGAAREIKVSNTYLYGMMRYRTINNYRHSGVNTERERREMKHRQRAKAFGKGRSTFEVRKKRQKYQRNIRKNRIEKLGYLGYATKMTTANVKYDPLVYMVGNAIKQKRFKRSVNKTIRSL
jgi:hypothetical protein